MGFFVGVILLFYSFICFYIKRKVTDPGVLFNLLWGCIAILAFLRLFNLNATSDYVFFIVFLGGTCFTVGTFFPRKPHGMRKKTFDINYKTMIPLYVMALCILAVMFFSALRLIISGVGFGQLRYLYMDQILSNYFLNVAYKFFAYPITVAMVILFVADFYIHQKMNIRLFFMAMSLTIMDLVAIADRMIIVYFLIGGMLVYNERSKRMTKKQKRKIRNIIFIGVIGFVGILLARGTRIDRIVGSIYTYLVGPLPYFTKRIEGIMDLPPTYITSSLQGLFRPIFGVLEILGIKWELFEQATQFLLGNQNILFEITSDGRTFNYFCTAFAYFYRDAGIVGVCIYSLCFGWLCQTLYSRGKISQDYMSVSGLVFAIVSIVLSFMNISFAEVGMIWGIIFLRIFVKDRTKRLMVS